MIIIQTDGIDLGDMVYLKTDEDQVARMVVAVIQFVDGGTQLMLAHGPNSSQHYTREVSKERNVTLVSTG